MKKIFCVGFHKTGTKSLAVALKSLGYRVTGPNGVHDPNIANNVYAMSRQLVERFDAFQDNPWPVIYKHLDRTYRNSKFVLTLRASDAWINSQLRHFGSDETPMREWIYGVSCPKGNEDVYIRRFENHNREIIDYFALRPDDLLVMNIENGDGWHELCAFLGRPIPHRPFPHANSSVDREQKRNSKEESERNLARIGKSTISRDNTLVRSKKELRHRLVGPAHLWKMKRHFQISFLKEMNLSPEHYLLDLGCGTLRGGIPIIKYLIKGHYFGIELRPEALSEGRKEVQESGLVRKAPTLINSADFSQLTINQHFDFVWAFSVLFHMDDAILNRALAFVNRHLAACGVLYANVNIGNRESGSWQGFPVVWRTFEDYVGICGQNGLHVVDLGYLQNFGHLSGVTSQDNQRMLRISRGSCSAPSTST